jgi:hypothetical protein
MISPRELTPLPDPLPGLTRLRRRLADRTALRDDLLARLAAVPDPTRAGTTLGDQLDVAGDPTVVIAAELWARVADGVCAYAELSAGELYLGTAQDWTDVRRVVDLVGYRPAQRTAAHGWIRVDTAPGAAPLLPAGTQVQAPGSAAHPAQTYEVAADTQLRADWAGLTVTAVPQPAAPTGDQLRFLTDPGFTASDRVVLVSESGAPAFPTDWTDWLAWWLALYFGTGYIGTTGQAVLGIVRVKKRSDDLGAVLLDFDRSLAPLLPEVAGTSYAAYRVRATLDVPSRLDALSYVDSGGTGRTTTPSYPSGEPTSPYGTASVLVSDGSEVSVGQQLILYGGELNHCLVTAVTSVVPQDWHVAPGTVKRVANIGFADPLPSELRNSTLTVLLTDQRQVAQHYDLPDLAPGVSAARVHPRLATLPPRLAVRTLAADGTAQWELTGASTNAEDSTNDEGGRLVNLTDARTGVISRGSATGNVVPIEHGTTNRGPISLTDGVAVLAGPVTGDVATDGTVTDSLVVTVDGERWDEVPSLYGRGPDELVYTTRLAADGRLVLSFGDGATGALPRGDVAAIWRVGGGLAGELAATEIANLVGAVNGVRRIGGVGALSGAADQEDPLRMRRAAAARIRALDRAVALGDLADLALTVPGTSHTVAFRGAGPPGCACGGSGIHVAVLRLAASGVRSPNTAELKALSGYLDARRDTTVGVCVCAAVAGAVDVRASVAVDARRDPATVLAAVRTALLDPTGPLAPVPRELGVPLDGSDVIEVAQPVSGVIGITDLTLSGGITSPAPGDLILGRLPAQPYELLYVSSADLVVRGDG